MFTPLHVPQAAQKQNLGPALVDGMGILYAVCISIWDGAVTAPYLFVLSEADDELV